MEYDELKVIRLDVLKVELGKRKLCACEQPQYTIDSQNRFVTCDLCGAIVDPYDALLKFAEKYEKYANQQKRLIEYIKSLSEECERLRDKRQQLTIFKDMASKYRQGLLPNCPNCGDMIDPTKIVSYINRKFYEVQKKGQTPTNNVEGENGNGNNAV